MIRQLLLFLFIVLGLQVFSQSDQINVMTYNIRYDNANDPVRWEERKSLIASQILFHDVDIVGLQEALDHQNKDLDTLLSDYTYVGVGRDDHQSKGEFCTIFYKESAYKLLNHGTFGLSEYPDSIACRSWDAALHRICSWVELIQLSTGEGIYIFNAHYDHVGVEARRNSSLVISQKIKGIAGPYPVILMGDFNCTMEEQAFQLLKKPLLEARENTELSYGPSTTFNGWKIKAEEKIIDHIFYCPDLKLIKYGIIATNFNGILPSDHYPVFSCFEIEYQE